MTISLRTLTVDDLDVADGILQAAYGGASRKQRLELYMRLQPDGWLLAALDGQPAGVAGGTPVAPIELAGTEPSAELPAGPSAAVLDALRPMMRQVVLSGTATALSDRGEVFGKTGTAEYGGNVPPDAHGWFMGYRLGGPAGDVAFAVLVEGGQSSSVAVGVTEAFLAGLG